MLFNLFVRKDINQGVEDWKATNGAVLLDVRTKEEYDNYHIDGSINIPMHELADIADKIPDKNTPIFVYCLSGARSADAVSQGKWISSGIQYRWNRHLQRANGVK